MSIPAVNDAAPLLVVNGLTKRFDEREVLRGVNLTVPRGALVSVIGRSGAGKSVFLKCLAGVIPAGSGTVCFCGQELNAATRPDFRQRSSFLFQSNALFDSLNALENVALPLEQTTDLSRSEIRQRSLEALRQLELEECAQRFPSQLSGGMQKRLALARAIVTRPELVLFDEPTAGLDPLRRNAVFTMIARYQRQFGFTALLVTHDVPEALIASDQVALLDGGLMAFQGTPAEFKQSTDRTVQDFLFSTQALSQQIQQLRALPTA
jgi:phospholipid/cholesterol/gamma-HCH transport system ATP-binding protein